MNDPEGGWMCAIKRLFSQFSIANTYAYDALQDLVHTLCLNSDTVIKIFMVNFSAFLNFLF